MSAYDLDILLSVPQGILSVSITVLGYLIVLYFFIDLILEILTRDL